MFDFNTSLNDVAPVSQIMLPIDAIQHKNVNLFCSYQCFYGTLRFLTPQIHCSAWKDVHQKTNSLNRQFTFDSPCDKYKMNFLDSFLL